MLRMSQKLLIILSIILFVPSEGSAGITFRYKFSLEKGEGAIHLRQPFGVFFDSNTKRIYVADTGNNRLVSFTCDGRPLRQFNAARKLRGPIALVRDKGGRLWVVERPANSLTFIDLKKHIFKRHYLELNDTLVIPDRLGLWNHFLIVLDRVTGKALLIDKQDLTIKRILAPKIKDFNGFVDIKIKGNTLWGLENKSGRIFGLNLKTGKERCFRPQASIILPISFEIDSQGNFYILDRDLKRVFVFDKRGYLQYKLLKEGFQPGQVRYPWQILMAGTKLLVIDEGNSRVDVWGH